MIEETIHYKNITNITPIELGSTAFKNGSVQVLCYDSYDYLGDSSALKKHVNVYLPFGFSNESQFEILYLLHGWSGNAEDFINDKPNCELKCILDALISNKMCRPIVVVSPTWDKDNQEQEWDWSCEEIEIFYKEYLNDIVPAVEQYVYGEKTNIYDNVNLRSIGGFSMGAIAMWYIMQQAPHMHKNYLPMCGECWTSREKGEAQDVYLRILQTLGESDKFDRHISIKQLTGTRDSRYKKIKQQADLLVELNKELNNVHYDLYVKDGGYHSYSMVWDFLFDILPNMFPYREKL